MRLAATHGTMSGSARPPETSLTMEAPASTAARATEARIVSTETTAPSAARAVTTGRSSSSTDGRSAPGRVDSPPTSTMSAPAASTSRPCAMAASCSNHSPPSEKESGVTLTTPMTIVRSRTPSREVASRSGRRAVMAAIVSRSVVRVSGRRSLVALEHERHGLCSSGRVAQLAAHRRGDGARAGLADAAHGHAEVLRLEDDDDALHVEVLDERVGDLRREPLMHLRAPGEDVDETRELGQSGDSPVLARDVADVRHPVEGHEVVLARAVELDVPHDDELLVVDLERRAEHVGRRHVEAGVDLGERPGHPARGVEQALAVGVLTDGEEQLPDGRLGARLVDRHPSALLVGVDGAVVRHLDDLLDGVLLGEGVRADGGRLVDLVLDDAVGGHRRGQVAVLA